MAFQNGHEFEPVLTGGAVQLQQVVPGEDGEVAVAWRIEAENADDAGEIFEWMDARPEHWGMWGRLAIGFGANGLAALVVDEARRDAREREARIAMERDEERERRDVENEISLYILDKRGSRPGLSLHSENPAATFWTMRYSERWERERVLDWMRWRKGRFVEWRSQITERGTMWFDQMIMAEMRETERDIKSRGLAARGNRPLRFWRGE